MATNAWDKVIPYGWYEKEPGLHENGSLQFKIVGAPHGVKRADGTAIYRNPIVRTAVIGDESATDSASRNQLRAALLNQARVLATAAGETLDEVAWGEWWDAKLPSLVCTSFYAPDDTDITPQGWQVHVTENIGGTSRTYPVPLTVDMLDPDKYPIPGINLATIEIPPGTPTRVDPSYAKGQPNGIPGLDGNAKIPVEFMPEDYDPGTGGGEKGDQGDPGPSAYDVAVANGFQGTEAQWLESLKAPEGEGLAGQSAYEIAVLQGYQGTQTQWIASLKGAKGDDGANGTYNWRYTGGSWPALPTTRPPGAIVLAAIGPDRPTSVPSWVGKAAGQVPMTYQYMELG